MSTLKDDFDATPGNWKILRLKAGDTPESVKLPVGPVLVPLSVWRTRRAELIRREYDHGWPLGVWLAAEEDPESVRDDVDDFTVIGVDSSNTGNRDRYLSVRLQLECLGYRGAITTAPQSRQ